jgi:hypothetical protein
MKKRNEQHEVNSIRDSVSSVVEAAATLVPLVAIIAGIGMMRTLPPASSTPLFSSGYQAQEFFRENGLPWDPHTPIVLSNASCDRCDTLRRELQQARVSFFEHSVSANTGAARLMDLTHQVTKQQELPVVIVGGHAVSPRVRAIRLALAKAEQPQ